jgi:3-methyladenine DNA glycosylase/8-oxoguanine DNA glycosylase
VGAEPAESTGRVSVLLQVAEPFNLVLSLRAAASFLPAIEPTSAALRAGMYVDGRPAIVEVRQSGKQIEAVGPACIGEEALREIAARLVNAALDLRAFYALCADHTVLGPVVGSLRGLKPLRPASLFEMLVIAITEQQLSLAAAFHIRRRLVEQFGRRLDGVWVFPPPAQLAVAPIAALKECGLSGRKAEYVQSLAGEIAAGQLALAALNTMSDTEAREMLARYRGLGEWSIEYFLARGLGRPDSLPAGDVGLRRVVGRYLTGGARLSPDGLRRVLAPFAPYRSLAAYYIAVHGRLFRPQAALASAISSGEVGS